MILVSSNLKIIRKNKGLSQREVASRADIRITNYAYIEQGKSEPKLKTALLIAKALGESVNRLFSLKEGDNGVKRFFKTNGGERCFRFIFKIRQSRKYENLWEGY